MVGACRSLSHRFVTAESRGFSPSWFTRPCSFIGGAAWRPNYDTATGYASSRSAPVCLFLYSLYQVGLFKWEWGLLNYFIKNVHVVRDSYALLMMMLQA